MITRTGTRFAAALLTIVILVPVAPASGRQTNVQAILSSPQFKEASAFIRKDDERFVQELVALTEIPAPPFKEQQRAKAFAERLRAAGLQHVEIDPEGNVIGIRKGRGGRPGMLAVVAHLDTVFPEGTDVTVKRDGTRLMAPGIGDNTRGLALMLAVVRAMQAARMETFSDILFVGDVGEEGLGNLRGIRYLLQKGKYKDRIEQFLAIDGGSQGAITRGAVGSKRYRVTFKGPGGHSYGAFGLVNPAYAMANAISKLAALEVPSQPRTTYNIGVVSGGTSVNAIPASVSMEADLRSESCSELRKLDDALLRIVREAVERENAARSTSAGRIVADTEIVGDRPCGATPMDAPILQTTAAVIRAFGLPLSYDAGSTDSNIPMSMGIPAVTIGRGGDGGRSHSIDEWTDVAPAGVRQSVEVALAIVLALAGVP